MKKEKAATRPIVNSFINHKITGGNQRLDVSDYNPIIVKKQTISSPAAEEFTLDLTGHLKQYRTMREVQHDY